MLWFQAPVQHGMMTLSASRDWKTSSDPAASADGSGLNGVPSPRRRFPRVSASPRCPSTIPEHPDEEQWVDGPRSSVCLAATESLSQSKASCPVKFVSEPTSYRSGVQATSSTELWVDGPAAFQTRFPKSRTTDIAGPSVSGRNSDMEPTVTSSRQSRKSLASHGEGVSKSHIPRTSATKSHSSPRLRHQTPPELDGRITAWVKSVEQANQPPGHQPDTGAVSDSQELHDVEDDKNRGNSEVRGEEDTGSVTDSSHSVYEHQLDESLETASLCGCAVLSSDEDAASLSKSRVHQVRDGIPDGCADDQVYSDQHCAVTKENIPEDVSEIPIKSRARSRVVEPVVRSASTSSQRSSNSPASQRSSSVPRRCLSSPRRNTSLHGNQSSEPARLKLPSTSKISAATSPNQSSDAVHDGSSVVMKKPAEQCTVVTGVSLQKSQKAVITKSQPLKNTASRNTSRCHASSPRSARADRRSGLPVASTEGGDGGGQCLVSPYQTVTSPRRRVAGCSTSSDSGTARSKSSEVELSSGYESMMRDDSEETITTHCNDWTGDSQGQSRLSCYLCDRVETLWN